MIRIAAGLDSIEKQRASVLFSMVPEIIGFASRKRLIIYNDVFAEAVFFEIEQPVKD